MIAVFVLFLLMICVPMARSIVLWLLGIALTMFFALLIAELIWSGVRGIVNFFRDRRFKKAIEEEGL